MQLNGKVVRLDQLQDELATAGIVIPALGIAGDDLHTYDAAGTVVDLPLAARPVVDAHVPRAAYTAEETAEDTDRTQRAALVGAVNDDRLALAAGAGSLTTAQRLARLEAALARTDTLLLLLIRMWIRRGS